MTMRRLIATPHMPAGSAQLPVQPAAADLQAILTPAGTLVFQRGERSVDFFVVLEGSIDIFERDDRGESKERGPGEPCELKLVVAGRDFGVSGEELITSLHAAEIIVRRICSMSSGVSYSSR